MSYNTHISPTQASLIRKYVINLVTILCCVIISAVPLTSAARTTLHQNEIIFRHWQKNFDYNIPPDSFLVERHSVTPHQPSGINDGAILPYHFLHLYHHYRSQTTFKVKAGRKRSRDVYNALTDWGLDTSAAPKEMNFAVMGTLSFIVSSDRAYVCKDVALAQASTGLRNKWYTFSLNKSGFYHGTWYTDITCVNTKSKLLRHYQIFDNWNGHDFFIKADGPEITK